MESIIQKFAGSIIAACLSCSTAYATERTFVAEGSDTMMGVGGRYVAMAGTSAAIGNDIYSIFSNPAGLSGVDGIQISFARQLNAEVTPFNFAGAAIAVPWLEAYGIDTVVGLAYIPRLHFEATGNYKASDFESVFLRYALPGIRADFDGTVVSKTKDYRLAVSFAPSGSDRWAVGFSVGRIDCATFVCGGGATSRRGYTMAITEATAFTMNAGARYKIRDDLTVAVSVKDINTELDVNVEITRRNGRIVNSVFQTGFPTDVTVGLLWNYNENLDLAVDYQQMFGAYGNYDIDVKILRFGAERRYGDVAMRYGALVPITIASSKLPDVVLPFPVAPTIGVGWHRENFDLDLALYGHPLMSYSRRTLVPALDLSLTYKF